MTSESDQPRPQHNKAITASETSAEAPAIDRRAEIRTTTARVLKQIAQEAKHELHVAISAQDALEELVPLLDRLLAVGVAARLQDTEEGWREAHRRLLNASVLIRVAELRHAVGSKMDYMPSKAGDKAQVLEWLAALERLRTELQDHGLKADTSPSET